MAASILYCGDTHLRSAAAYLAGVLTSGGEPFTYTASDRDLDPAAVTDDLRLLILSDYPAARLATPLQQQLADRVANGVGLLMIGGWESYHGLGGDWNGTPLGEVLPVVISPADDRLNSDRPLLVRRSEKHPITRGLPWKERPPHVGGLNRIQPKPVSTVLLEADRLTAVRKRRRWTFDIDETFPLLVVGEHGRGRTAALATDLAPHWVGGFVDWGDGRVAAQAPEADAIEVGDLYAQFILQLIRWNKGA
jgi:hypothetical protein